MHVREQISGTDAYQRVRARHGAKKSTSHPISSQHSCPHLDASNHSPVPPSAMADTRRPLGPTHDNPSASGALEPEGSASPKLFPIFLSPASAGTDSRRPAKQRRTRATGSDNGKVTTKASDDECARDVDRHLNRLSTYFAPSTPLRVGTGNCARPSRSEPTQVSSSAHLWRRSRKRLGLAARSYTAEGVFPPWGSGEADARSSPRDFGDPTLLRPSTTAFHSVPAFYEQPDRAGARL